MQRYPLGRFSVARVGFGAMQLPGPGVFGPPRDRDEVLAVLRRAAELFEQACDGGDAHACLDIASLLAKGEGVAADSERAEAPLRPASDAIVLDTTHLGLPEVIDQLIAIVQPHLDR